MSNTTSTSTVKITIPMVGGSPILDSPASTKSLKDPKALRHWANKDDSVTLSWNEGKNFAVSSSFEESKILWPNAPANKIAADQVKDLVLSTSWVKKEFQGKVYVSECLNVIQELLEIFGCPKRITEDTKDHWYQCCREVGDAIKFIKYKITAFDDIIRGQPTPPSPLRQVEDRADKLVGGGAGIWLKHFLKKKGDKPYEFLSSLKRAKFGMPRPSQKYCKYEEAENFFLLTTKPDPIKKAFLGDFNATSLPTSSSIQYDLNRESFIKELKRTAHEVYQNQPFEIWDQVKAMFPSTSANFRTTRKDLGTVGILFNREYINQVCGTEGYEGNWLMDGLRKPGGWIKPEPRVLTKEGELCSICQNNPNDNNNCNCQQFKRYHSTEEQIEQETFDFSLKDLEDKFGELMFRLHNTAKCELNVAETLALPEPLKVRIITKMPPLRQFMLANFQKFLHHKLKQWKIFKLVGEPLSEEILLNCLGRNLPEGWVFHSGDLRNATNTLHSWVSEALAEEICEPQNCALSLEYSEMFIEALVKHHVQTNLSAYFLLDPIKGTKEEVVDPTPKMKECLHGEHIHLSGVQENGQLMGSNMSFPILCLAIATICRWAYEITTHRKTLLKDLPCAINGDDNLTKCPSKYPEVWRKIMQFAGLEESVGKTYTSPEFLDINSTTVVYRPLEPKLIYSIDNNKVRECPYKIIKYVHMGLLKGLAKSPRGEENQVEKLNLLGTRATELLNFCPQDMKEIVLEHFIKHNNGLLKASGLPWFIPSWLGGIGLPILKKENVSELDRRMAQYILYNFHQVQPIPLNRPDNYWRVWDLAAKRLPKANFVAIKSKETEYYQDITAKECVNLLFDENIQVEDLINEVRRKTNLRSFTRHNQKLWKPRRGALPQPLPIEALERITPRPQFDIGPNFGETLSTLIRLRVATLDKLD